MDEKKPLKKRNVLGKGLSALLDDAGFDANKKQDPHVALGTVFELPVDHNQTFGGVDVVG